MQKDVDILKVKTVSLDKNTSKNQDQTVNQISRLEKLFFETDLQIENINVKF
jgi:hypothetical protein